MQDVYGPGYVSVLTHILTYYLSSIRAQEIGSRGIVFFSSSNSAKGSELNSNPHATAVFYYPSHYCERYVLWLIFIAWLTRCNLILALFKGRSAWKERYSSSVKRNAWLAGTLCLGRYQTHATNKRVNWTNGSRDWQIAYHVIKEQGTVRMSWLIVK